MCGIAGALHLDGGSIAPRLIQQSAALIAHRGPDGDGFLLANTRQHVYQPCSGDHTPQGISAPHVLSDVGLVPDLLMAHRRLAIIDLSPAGHEPMTYQDGASPLWMVFNGEIYNYLEIRDQLRALGYSFHTESDAEVILAAYRAWDTACVDRFVGMFAFAIWDDARQRLWCVRDRFGVKPLYYSVENGVFAFASEIKALKPFAPAGYAPDHAVLAHFLHTGTITYAPRTFYTGIHELPASHALIVQHGKVSDPYRYYHVDSEAASARYDLSSEAATAQACLSLLQDAVRLRLRSDVPVGTCLSGGLDSSAIVALATRQLNGGSAHGDQRMNSFSAVYPVKGIDESRYIDLVAGEFRTHAHRIFPQPDDFLAILRKITWHQDIPTASSGVYTQYHVMQLAHGKVTVLLDGQGSDELFGGYLSYVVKHLNLLRRRDPIAWTRQMALFTAQVRARFNPSLNGREFLTRAGDYVTGRKDESLSPVALEAARDLHLNGHAPFNGGDPLNTHLHNAVTRDSIPALLHYEDRNSMAYAIEARVPFLDHRLVEFALAVPADHKIRGADTKLVLRRSLRGILPDAIIDRKDKLGYPTPLGQWMRGALRQPISAYLESDVIPRGTRDGWLNGDAVRRAWSQHQAGSHSHERAIFRVLTAALWLDQ
jgi:asparagine synthase (glutamine-hydrolysing)